MAQSNLVGQTILGYTVAERINSGASGTVYKVVKENISGQYVRAMKHITIPTEKQYMSVLNSMGGDQSKANDYFTELLKEIVSEITILNDLSEKGVPHIVLYYEHDIRPMENPLRYDIYILMEYLTPLDDYLMSHDFYVRDVITLAEDVLEGLGACHENNIMHRDIKDDNIFMSENGGFKMGDFGVSKILKESTRAESMRGTPNFLAPEVYLGRESYNTSVDLYSLGIVLYRLLNYNRNPFLPKFPEQYYAPDEDRAFDERMSGKIPDLPLLGGEKIGSVVVKAISGSTERYQSAAEFMEDLRAAAEQTDPEILNTSTRISFTGTPEIQGVSEIPMQHVGSVFGETMGQPSIAGNDTFTVQGSPDVNRHLFDSIADTSGFSVYPQGQPGTSEIQPWIRVGANPGSGMEGYGLNGGRKNNRRVIMIAMIVAAILVLTTGSAFGFTRVQNQKQANKVIDRIEALAEPDDLSLNDQADVYTARKLYDELTSAQKKLVSNKEDLLGAECVMDQLEKKEELENTDLTEEQKDNQEQILNQQKNDVSRQNTTNQETAAYSYPVKNPVSWGAYEVTTTSEDLLVRSGPGEGYKKITAMPGGTVVYVYGCYNGWYYVNYQGKWGWAKSKYLTSKASTSIIADPVVSEGYQSVEENPSYSGDCKVNAIELNVRSGPDKSYSSKDTIKKNDVVKVFGSCDGWDYINHQDEWGWVNAKYLIDSSNTENAESSSETVQQPPSYKELGEYTVATKKDDLYLRTKPKTNASSIGKIPKGAIVDAMYIDGRWYFVKYNSLEGWVDGTFLKKESSKEVTPSNLSDLGEYYVNASTLSLRIGPGTDYKQILSMNRNDKIHVYGSESGWYYVEYNGNKGWAKSEFLKKVEEEQPEEEVVSEETETDNSAGTSQGDSSTADDSSNSDGSNTSGVSGSTSGSTSGSSDSAAAGIS